MGRRASPRCWHVVKKHAQCLVCTPPKFHCFSRHPTLRGAAAWLLACSRGWRFGPGRGDPPTPILPAGTAEPRRLCLKVGLPGPHSLPVGPGHSLRWGWGVFTIEGMRPWPPNRPRVSVALESWTFLKLPVSKSFPTMSLRHDEESGRRASSLKRRVVRMSPSVTSRLGCKGTE